MTPGQSHVIYTSTGISHRETANSIPDSKTAGRVGVVKSTDSGQTWIEVNNGLANSLSASLYAS